MSFSSCSTGNKEQDLKTLHMAEGYYHLGRYEESIVTANSIKSGSPFYGESRELIDKVRQAKISPPLRTREDVADIIAASKKNG